MDENLIKPVRQDGSIDYEEAMNMLLKSLEKSEVFQLRAHISKMGMLIIGILIAFDVVLMGYSISLRTEIARLRQENTTIQQYFIEKDTAEEAPKEEESKQGTTEETTFNTSAPTSSTEVLQQYQMIVQEEYQEAMTECMSRQSCTEEWFREYKALLNEYSADAPEFKYIDIPEQLSDVFSAEEIGIFGSCVESETSGAPFNCRVNVANVILNRYEDGNWGNSLSAIITSPGQFAHGKLVVTETTKLALEYAFMFPDTTQGALYFNRGTATTTSNLAYNYIFTDEIGHSFFKKKTGSVNTVDITENNIITDDLTDDDSVG